MESSRGGEMAGVEGGVERMRAMLFSSLIGLEVGMQDTPSLGGSSDCWRLQSL